MPQNDLELTPEQRKRLLKALIKASPGLSDLLTFVVLATGVQLNDAEVRLTDANDVLKWAEANGKVRELYEALKSDPNKPNIPAVAAFLQSIELPQSLEPGDQETKTWYRSRIVVVTGVAILAIVLLAVSYRSYRNSWSRVWEDPFLSQDNTVNKDLWEAVPNGWTYDKRNDTPLLRIQGPRAGVFPRTALLQTLTDYDVKFRLIYEDGLQQVSWFLRYDGGSGRGYKFTFTFPSRDGEQDVMFRAEELPSHALLKQTLGTVRRLFKLSPQDELNVFASLRGESISHKFTIDDAAFREGRALSPRNPPIAFEIKHSSKSYSSGGFGIAHDNLLLANPLRLEVR